MRKADLARQLARCGERQQEVSGQLAEARRELAQLERALDAVPAAVVVYDPDGSLAFQNSSADRLLRPGHAGALARGAIDEALVAAAGDGEPVTRTLEILGPPPRTLVVSARPKPAAESPLGSLCVVEDITERRQLEAVRRDFVANVSHELRTPVGALAVLAETMADEDDPASLRRLAVRVGVEAARAQRLIEELLDLSRIEAEGLRQSRPVDMVEVVRAATERVSEPAERNQIEIRLVTGGSHPRVLGDERQLVNAVTNLLDNAVKYSDPKSAVDVAVEAADGWVDVAVTDRGVGIPARALDRVFERFYRVDRGRSRDTGGSGLGLAIVRHVALNHGGSVLVESREGEGSTFTFRLPEGCR